jgi:hypothetical protein
LALARKTRKKRLVIPFKELKVSTRDGKDWLVLNRTKDELKLASEYRGQGVRQGGGVMKAALPLVLTALLGLGSGGGAVAQIAPGDHAGNQTIPEKDLSRPAEGLDKSGGVIKPTEGVDP